MTTSKSFSIYECRSCKAGVLNPAPTKDIDKLYPVHYLSGEDASKKRFDPERWYRYNQYKFDFKLLYYSTGLDLGEVISYIDIGCGSGERVTFARKRGCTRAFGIDKFDFAKNKSKKEAQIINSEILNYSPVHKFEVASLFHVLEHLNNPKEVLEHIKSNILQKKGYLILQVPNYGSLERRVFNSRWFGLDPPRHYWHFNSKALKKMLESSGYTVESVYQVNALLHPVTIAPSINRELDVQRIWVNKNYSVNQRTLLKLGWVLGTIASIPLNIFQNIFHRASMLTIVASVE